MNSENNSLKIFFIVLLSLPYGSAVSEVKILPSDVEIYDCKVPILEISGNFQYPDMKKVIQTHREILKKSESCSAGLPITMIISLRNVAGGDYVAALRLSNYFRSNSVATWVPDDSFCRSACSLLWASGTYGSNREFVHGDSNKRARFIGQNVSIELHPPFDSFRSFAAKKNNLVNSISESAEHREEIASYIYAMKLAETVSEYFSTLQTLGFDEKTINQVSLSYPSIKAAILRSANDVKVRSEKLYKLSVREFRQLSALPATRLSFTVGQDSVLSFCDSYLGSRDPGVIPNAIYRGASGWVPVKIDELEFRNSGEARLWEDQITSFSRPALRTFKSTFNGYAQRQRSSLICGITRIGSDVAVVLAYCLNGAAGSFQREQSSPQFCNILVIENLMGKLVRGGTSLADWFQPSQYEYRSNKFFTFIGW